MKKECVRRENVIQSHFVERKMSLCESIIIFGNHWMEYLSL